MGPWQLTGSLGTRPGSTEAYFALMHVKNSELVRAFTLRPGLISTMWGG